MASCSDAGSVRSTDTHLWQRRGGGGCRVVDFGGCGLLSGCWVGVG